jgi:O-antigen/teichoic acid export membrane protein
LLTFLNLAWLPRIFAITDRPTRAAVLAESRDGLYRLLVPVIIGIALGGPLVLHIWAPKSFHTEGLIPVVVLVVCSTIPVCTSFVYSRLILAEGRSTLVAMVTVAAALLNIGLNLALVPSLGINGSALATLITYAVLATGMALVSRPLMALPRAARGLWVLLAAAMGFTLATRYLPIHGLGLALRSLGTVLCGAWAIVVLRRLQGAEASEPADPPSEDPD